MFNRRKGQTALEFLMLRNHPISSSKNSKGQAALKFLMLRNHPISGSRKSARFPERKNISFYCSKNSKGQAALEFLMTYGWAILIIFIMIGALVYFGVFNPSKLTPERCTAEIGFQCEEWDVTNVGIQVRLTNSKGAALTNVALKSVSSLNFVNPPTCTIGNSSWSAGGSDTIGCTGTNIFGGVSGDKAKISFTLNYKPLRGTFTKEFDTEVFGTIR